MKIAYLLAVAATAMATPASAKIVSFKASGTVETIKAFGASSGTVPLGSPVSISFSIDTNNIGCCMDGDYAYASYADLPIFDLVASIGDFTFTKNIGPLSSSLGLLGDPYNNKLIATVVAIGGLSANSGQSLPFPVDPGSEQTLRVGNIFKNYHTEAIDIDTLLMPGKLIEGGFSYQVYGPGVAQISFVSGNLTGGFSTASSVPDVASWLTLLTGFAIAGCVIRRRRNAYRRIEQR